MSRCVDVAPRLSDFVDGDLSPDTAAMVEAHLHACPACRSLAADLRAVSLAGSMLDRPDPPDRVWAAIADRLATKPSVSWHARPSRWKWPALAAAALLVALLGVVFGRLLRPDAPRLAGNAETTPSVKTIEQELSEAERHYGRAIADLEAVARSHDGSLDPAIAQTLRDSLATIDGAIEQSRRALRTEPDNDVARASLFDALHSKVAVLQTVVSLGGRVFSESPATGTRRGGVGVERHKS
jgi:hypothetical protein